MARGAATLVLLMLLSSPLAAFIGTGEDDTGYRDCGRGGPRATALIHDVLELQNMSLGLNGVYELASDIDASATRGWNGGKGFAPVGNLTDPFTGWLDGNGFTITGLCINRSTQDHVGLFGSLWRTSMIKDLKLVLSEVAGRDYTGGLAGQCNGTVLNCSGNVSVNGSGRDVGGLVGFNAQGNVTNCISTGPVNLTGSYGGGLVGYNWGTITNCLSAGPVFSSGSLAGGLTGYNDYGTITNCTSTGPVNGSKNLVGGLAGRNLEGTISGCSSTGPVKGVHYVGGLVGEGYYGGNILKCTSTGPVRGSDHVGGLVGNIGQLTHISGCTSTGPVNGRSEVGGLVGHSTHGYLSNCTSVSSVTASGYSVGGLVGMNDDFAGNDHSTISNCSSHGPVSGASEVGGLVGTHSLQTISQCYSTGRVNGSSNAGGLVGAGLGNVTDSYWDYESSGMATSAAGSGKAGWEMKHLATFDGWDFRTVWAMVEDETYPFLRKSNRTALGFDFGLCIMNNPPTTVGMDEEYRVQLLAYDPDVDARFHWSLDTNASWLKIDSGTGLLSGTPGHSEVTAYRVNLTVSNGAGKSASKEFVLTVRMKHPPAWSRVPGDSGLTEGDEYGFTANATDEDAGDVIRYAMVSKPSCGISVNLTSGAIIWSNVLAGKYSINITATDGLYRIWHVFNLTVLARNRPPAWADVPADTRLTEGEDFNFTAKATDADADDAIAYGLTCEPSCDITMDGLSGAIIWTGVQRGNFSINITAFDGHITIWHVFNLTVNKANHLPIGVIKTPINMTQFRKGTFVTFTAEGRDEDGDALTFIWKDAAGVDLGRGTTFSTDKLPRGFQTITCEISDGKGFSTQKVSIVIVNFAPEILSVTAPDNAKVKSSEMLQFSVNAIDQDGDNLTYMWTENGTTLSIESGFARAFPPGNHTVMLSVSDGETNTTRIFRFTVTPAPKPPEPKKGFIPGFEAMAVAAALVSMALFRRAGSGWRHEPAWGQDRVRGSTDSFPRPKRLSACSFPPGGRLEPLPPK